MDRQALSVVRTACAEMQREVARILTSVNEQWVSDKELCKEVQCFTPRWLRDHGKSIGGVQPTWTDKNGVEHKMKCLYPLHEIKMKFLDGSIKELRDTNC